MYRYAVTNYKQPSLPSAPSVETPSLVTGIVSHASREMQEAMASITSPGFRRPRDLNERSMRLDRFPSSGSEAVSETRNDEEVSLSPPPPPPPPPSPSPPVAAP